MIWLIIFAVIAVGFGIWGGIDNDSFGIGVLFTFLFLGLAFLLAVLATGVTTYLAEEYAEKEWVTVEEKEIYSLNENLITEGSFTLGAGNIEGEMYYYYVEDTELGYMVKKVNASDAYIKYTDEFPCIEKQQSIYKNWFIRYATAPVERYIIQCPENTILKHYIVDLE